MPSNIASKTLNLELKSIGDNTALSSISNLMSNSLLSNQQRNMSNMEIGKLTMNNMPNLRLNNMTNISNTVSNVQRMELSNKTINNKAFNNMNQNYDNYYGNLPYAHNIDNNEIADTNSYDKNTKYDSYKNSASPLLSENVNLTTNEDLINSNIKSNIENKENTLNKNNINNDNVLLKKDDDDYKNENLIISLEDRLNGLNMKLSRLNSTVSKASNNNLFSNQKFGSLLNNTGKINTNYNLKEDNLNPSSPYDIDKDYMSMEQIHLNNNQEYNDYEQDNNENNEEERCFKKSDE